MTKTEPTPTKVSETDPIRQDLEHVLNPTYVKRLAMVADQVADDQLKSISRIYENHNCLLDRLFMARNIRELRQFVYDLDIVIEGVTNTINMDYKPKGLPNDCNIKKVHYLDMLMDPLPPRQVTSKDMYNRFNTFGQKENHIKNRFMEIGEKSIDNGQLNETLLAYSEAKNSDPPIKELMDLGRTLKEKDKEQAILVWSATVQKIREELQSKFYKTMGGDSKYVIEMEALLKKAEENLNELTGSITVKKHLPFANRTGITIPKKENGEAYTFEELIERGESNLKRGHTTEAINFYVEARKELKSDLIRFGERCAERGLLDLTLSAYQAADEKIPDELLIQIGNVCVEEGLMVEAKKAYERANQVLSFEQLDKIGQACLRKARYAYEVDGLTFSKETITNIETKCDKGITWLFQAYKAFTEARAELPPEVKAVEEILKTERVPLSNKAMKNLLLGSLKELKELSVHLTSYFSYVDKIEATRLDAITADDRNLTDKVIKILFDSQTEEEDDVLRQAYYTLADIIENEIKSKDYQPSFPVELALSAFLEDYVKGCSVKHATLASMLDREEFVKDILTTLSKKNNARYEEYIKDYLKDKKITSDEENDQVIYFDRVVNMLADFGLIQIFEPQQETRFFEKRAINQDDIIRLTPNRFSAFFSAYTGQTKVFDSEDLVDVVEELSFMPQNPFPQLYKLNKILATVIPRTIAKGTAEYEKLGELVSELKEKVRADIANRGISKVAAKSLEFWESVIKESKDYNAIRFWSKNITKEDIVATFEKTRKKHNQFENPLPYMAGMFINALKDYGLITSELGFELEEKLNEIPLDDPIVGRALLLTEICKYTLKTKQDIIEKKAEERKNRLFLIKDDVEND
jgi:tetratricopeptide (TPR) repeat protein